MSAFEYPVSRQDDCIETYHGIAVPDPYRWLENLDSAETAAWVEAQNAVTQTYLATISSRNAIADRLAALWDYEKYGTPFKVGDRYFYFKNDGLQNQSVLYVLSALAAEPRVLLDPNTLSEDGTVALAGISISDDGNWLAYGLSRSGSDWQEWQVRAIASGKDLPDKLQWIKFSGAAWRKDNAGFFYSRYDEPAAAAQFEQANYYQKLCYHSLGSDQSADRLIYERPDAKEWLFSAGVSEDGRYLIRVC